MTWRKLNWFALRFPQGLEDKDVLAALSAFSGVPFRARLVLELSATNEGITHRLAVTPSDTETVTAALRAAMPSLRMEATDTPPRTIARRWLWQLAPRAAALRTDELAAISAALLSSLFPLREGEISTAALEPAELVQAALAGRPL